MTRRKDSEPQAEPPPSAPPVESAVGEPFVVTDPVDAPPPTPEPSPESPAQPAPEPPPQVVVRRSSFLAPLLAPLLGGTFAAVAGFALSHFDALGLRPANSSADLTAVDARLDQIESRITGLDAAGADLAALTDRVGTLEAAPEPEPPDLSRIDALDQRLAAIEAMPSSGAASTAALTAKLAEIERRLAAVSQDASPELQGQLDAALARLDEAEATATARSAEAAAATAAAERTRALDALSARVSAGEPFAPELKALDDPAVAEVLAPLADSGVPTLAQLQTAFPDAAREALRIARDTSASDGWGSRALDFLASQTGARPLTPLEGSTPDAILSRADFALSEGRVADAVAELQPLDATVKAALDPWLIDAQAHVSASAALQAARGE